MRTVKIPFLGTIVLFGKEQGYITFEPELRGRLIKGPNHPTVFGYGSTTGKRELSLGRLARGAHAREYALAEGDVMLSRRVITDAGVQYMRDDFNNAAGAADITNFNYHGNGTGTATENQTQTALGTEVETRASGTRSTPAANQYQTVGTISITNTRAITEHGIFTAASNGTLWDRSTFAAIHVVSGDSIQFTYVLTISAGG